MTDFTAQQESKLRAAMHSLRGTFRLSGQHAGAGPFRVNRLASYVGSSLTPQIVIQSRVNGRWVDYMRHDAAYFLARYMGRVSQETECTRCGFELPEDPQWSWDDVTCPCCNKIN